MQVHVDRQGGAVTASEPEVGAVLDPFDEGLRRVAEPGVVVAGDRDVPLEGREAARAAREARGGLAGRVARRASNFLVHSWVLGAASEDRKRIAIEAARRERERGQREGEARAKRLERDPFAVRVERAHDRDPRLGRAERVVMTYLSRDDDLRPLADRRVEEIARRAGADRSPFHRSVRRSRHEQMSDAEPLFDPGDEGRTSNRLERADATHSRGHLPAGDGRRCQPEQIERRLFVGVRRPERPQDDVADAAYLPGTTVSSRTLVTTVSCFPALPTAGLVPGSPKNVPLPWVRKLHPR